MAADNYQIWTPIANFADELYFLELHNEAGGLIVLLKTFKHPHKVLRVRFNGILAYRVVQESGRLKTINESEGLSPFCTSTDSSFLRWFDEESGGIFENTGLVHYDM